MQCDVCNLPDLYNGQGDGIGSSLLCDCPGDDVDEASTDTEIVAVRPGKPPRTITDHDLPGGDGPAPHNG
jgi:hypothetical protein